MMTPRCNYMIIFLVKIFSANMCLHHAQIWYLSIRSDLGELPTLQQCCSVLITIIYVMTARHNYILQSLHKYTKT